MRGPMNTISDMDSHVLRCSLGAYQLSCTYRTYMYGVEYVVGNDGWNHEDICSCHRIYSYIHAQAYWILVLFFLNIHMESIIVFIWQQRMSSPEWSCIYVLHRCTPLISNSRASLTNCNRHRLQIELAKPLSGCRHWQGIWLVPFGYLQ